MLSFKSYLQESTKEITIAWGRLNPPTIGHEKLINAAAKNSGSGEYRIYITQTQNKKTDPLSHSEKIKYARKMFPRHARSIIDDKSIKTLFDLFGKLYAEGFRHLKLIAGSDRVPEYERLIAKYNGKEQPAGRYYNFETYKVVSAGARDPDAAGAEGMSASKMREAAKNNDFAKFKEGLPRTFEEAQSLFDDVRKGLGINEESDYRIKVNLNKDAIREKYVSGKLFSQGDNVIDKITGENCVVKFLGSNYVIVENDKSESNRRWITDISHIDEETPALDAVRDRKEREKDALKQKYEREKQSARERDRRAKEMRSEETTFKSFITYQRIRRK